MYDRLNNRSVVSNPNGLTSRSTTLYSKYRGKAEKERCDDDDGDQYQGPSTRAQSLGVQRVADDDVTIDGQ